MKIEAKIIADSVANDIRITTMELCLHRFIHSEFMTHRMFSRNAASSRAIPVKKMLEQVRQDPAMPIHWGKNQPGMQAREETNHVGLATYHWEMAAEDMIHRAEKLMDAEVHKQVTNRLLEPFQWIKVIVTATEYTNFFKLRMHPDAQPEIAALASSMKEAMEASSPVTLLPGQWHLPYLSKDEKDNLLLDEEYTDFTLEDAKKCSVARCARVSYLNHGKTFPDREKDISLADKLLGAGHMSPFEHVATPMTKTWDTFNDSMNNYLEKGITHVDRDGDFWSGNFKGWLQYRQIL